MDAKFFSLMMRAVVLAHPWPTNLDESLGRIYPGMACSWVLISFEKTLTITPVTFN